MLSKSKYIFMWLFIHFMCYFNYFYTILGLILWPGTLIKWWLCPCSALLYWFERRWGSLGSLSKPRHNILSHFYFITFTLNMWKSFATKNVFYFLSFVSFLFLLSDPGTDAELQSDAGLLSVPAGQALWSVLWHGGQGPAVRPPCGHLQTMANVES